MIITLLNIISVLATLIVAQGVVYSLLNVVFGKIPIINIYLLKSKIQYKDIIFLLIGLIFILFFFDFYLPWY